MCVFNRVVRFVLFRIKIYTSLVKFADLLNFKQVWCAILAKGPLDPPNFSGRLDIYAFIMVIGKQVLRVCFGSCRSGKVSCILGLPGGV